MVLYVVPTFLHIIDVAIEQTAVGTKVKKRLIIATFAVQLSAISR